MQLRTFFLYLILLFSFTMPAMAQNKATKAADDAFADQLYFTALQKYQKASSKVKNNKTERDRISFRIAECYRMMNNTKKAETAYKRLLNNVKFIKDEPRVLLYYANALKANGNYDEAIKQYQAYKDLSPKDPRGEQGIASCKMAKEWIANPSKYNVKWEKPLNSKEDDFAPAYADKKFGSILFTSDRDASNGKDIDNWTGLKFSDFYLSRKDRKGEWSKPVLADQAGMLNTKTNDGVGQFDSRFTHFYFTRCYNDSRKKNGCQIFVSSRTGTSNWSDPEKVDLGGDSTSVYGHPSIASGDVIYFSAELPGGQGGKDIWRASKKGGKWIKENLGPAINTPGNELFPFIRNDSVLYFASDGWPGMGGMDIFRSVYSKGKWTTPENLKPPINSAADDVAIVFNAEESEEGLFTSNRPGGKGRDDIYSFVIPPIYYTLEGIVTDDKSLLPVLGAEVRATGTNGRSFKYTTDEKGHYSFNKMQITANTTYDITVTKKDYFNEKGRETTVGLEKGKDLTRNFVLKPIPKKPVVLPDILYDLAKWDLKPQYQDSLQGLIQTLDANETIVIELAAYTDSRDSEERNDILSQKRAQSVVDYLITRGIEPDRLVAKGYGERVPRTLNKDYVREGYTFKAGTVLTDSVINLLSNTSVKEAAHQLNRRTEFTILRNDYVPKSNVSGTQAAPKIEVVVAPEVNGAMLTKLKEGSYSGFCFVNGISTAFTYDPAEKDLYITAALAFQLLKEGVIDKNDFEGDATKFIQAKTISEKAVITLKEVRIAKNTVKDLKVIVNSKAHGSFVFGENTLKKFGIFKIDDAKGQLIFD
ncbi:MAG: OmpA family protein [Bacteroidota bacterium]|jgi:peptidoglycan-associated lipoprotein